jgi:hypothetical protein
MPRYVVGICEEHLTDFEYDVQAASAEEARSKTERALPGTLAIYGVGESLVLSRTVMWCDPYRPSRDDRDALEDKIYSRMPPSDPKHRDFSVMAREESRIEDVHVVEAESPQEARELARRGDPRVELLNGVKSQHEIILHREILRVIDLDDDRNDDREAA